MSREQVLVRYDGPVLADHSMAVDDLAPALLAIAELCKIANKDFNGDSATVKVFVNADLDQNCFELRLELVQTFLSHANMLIGSENVATAKELLEWLGIITGTSVLGLFGYLKCLKGRKIERIEYRTVENKNICQVNIEGDNNNIIVHPQAIALTNNTRTINYAQKAVKPLTNEGYETLEFITNDGRKEEITKGEAEDIVNIDIGEQLGIDEKEEPQIITASIRVYSPVYEKGAKNWRFDYSGRYETMDISETDIAENAIKRGGALVNDTYKVKLEIAQTKTPSGNFKNRYKIKEVVDFFPAKLEQQNDLFDNDQS